MAVGGIRGGGKGGPKGPKGAGGKAPSGGGSSFKVDKSESLVGASREASSSNVGGVGSTGAASGASGAHGVSGAGAAGGAGKAGKAAAADPVAAQAMEIAKQLKSGQLKSKEEATKKFVAEILKEKLRMQSKALTSRIADSLQDDPRLNQALERIWAKG